MTANPRYLEKFENSAGTVTVTFDGQEYEAQQAYRVAEAQVAGADYSHDFAGSAPWAKDVGIEAIRGELFGASAADVDTAFDSLVSKCRSVGRGKLYMVDGSGTRRWAWAKLTGRPSYSVHAESFFTLAYSMTFRRYSDWYATTATTGSQLIDTASEAVTINNPGNAPVLNAVFRLRSNSATGAVDPTMTNTNTNNGYAWTTTRDLLAANAEIRVDCGASKVEYSSDDGATYADDYALFSIGEKQVGFMRLDPGDNAIVMSVASGTPNYSLEWSFYAPYE